jgi:four helix bundle protein
MGGTYHDLKVWQNAMELTVAAYRVTQKFPTHETYGLAAQMRRAAVSIASNIAEGKGRSSDKELLQFLSHARGSAYELQTQIELAQMLKYLTEADEQELIQKSQSVGRMLNKLISSIRESIAQPAA